MPEPRVMSCWSSLWSLPASMPAHRPLGSFLLAIMHTLLPLCTFRTHSTIQFSDGCELRAAFGTALPPSMQSAVSQAAGNQGTCATRTGAMPAYHHS